MNAIVQIAWHAMQPDPEAPADWGGWPCYVRCAVCDETAYEDISAGKREDDFRQFHKVIGGPDDGLVVCEHCLEGFLVEGQQ